jgi:hypothetical protein
MDRGPAAPTGTAAEKEVSLSPAHRMHPPESRSKPRPQILSLQQRIEVVSIRQKQVILEQTLDVVMHTSGESRLENGSL